MDKKILNGILISVVILSSSGYLLAQEEPKEPVLESVEQAEELPPRPPMGLTVEPGGMLVQYVPLGITYDFYESVGIPLTIYNKDIEPHTYILSTDKPSNVAARKWLKGYLEIPEPSWLWFEQNEVRIEPNTKAKVKMYLKIPNEEKYYNQHWSVALGVKGKPEPGQMLALAVYPRIQIETLPSDDVEEKPDGMLGFLPSILSFDNLALGKKEKLKVRIYNNDTKRHRYKVRSKVFPKDVQRESLHASPAYSWIPNAKWIKPTRRSIAIDSQESRELTLSVKVPEDKENYNRNWEGILFIEPDEGLPGFARIQIKTEPLKNED